MSEIPQFDPDKDTHKGDFEGVYNGEFQNELREEMPENTEEELSSIDKALIKLENLKTLFDQDPVFNLNIPEIIDKGWYWKMGKTEWNIIDDTYKANHFFHHARHGRTLIILESGYLKGSSLSCYPFWDITDTERMKKSYKGDSVNDTMNEIDTTFVISHSKTVDIQERIEKDLEFENYVGFYPQYAELTQNQRIKKEDFVAIIINTDIEVMGASDKSQIYYQIAGIFGENSDCPIFDMQGNLLWPKQMSYEEVKQFVADRDAKKKEVSELTSISEPEIQPDELP